MVPEAMASPRPGQRQVAPPPKVRRGTVGTLEEAKLAAAKRSAAAAADDSLASLAGRRDDSQQQVHPVSVGVHPHILALTKLFVYSISLQWRL